jgi:hypothetical protein
VQVLRKSYEPNFFYSKNRAFWGLKKKFSYDFFKMLSFEGIVDKITVCKKLKSFTEEIFKKLSKNLQI